jgi:hypothetical protein
MDIYNVINESKAKKTIISSEEASKLFSIPNENILFRIAGGLDEDDDLMDLVELILKSKDDYYAAKEDTEDFLKEFNFKLKKIKNVKKLKEELFGKMDDLAKNYNYIEKNPDAPNSIILKMFLNEWNTKHSFTWRGFKQVKKNYEKNHILSGENLFVLKEILEKDPHIASRNGFEKSKSGRIKDVSGKVVDGTIFCKAAHTLSNDTIEAIKKRIENME